jgi:hypothetical protein
MKLISLRKMIFAGVFGLLFFTSANSVRAQSIAIPTVTPVVAIPTATPAASAVLSVACVNDAGTIVNVANPATVCQASLSKCSDLYASTQAKVKALLSWKIWGYYNGKDIDLSQNQSAVTGLIGNTMPNQICSVVGQKVQVNGAPADVELTKQTIAQKASCGILPALTAQTDGKKLYLSYQNGAGSLWISYMLGAYPWLIRKVASDVFTQLNPDFSNINTVISNQTMAADVMSATTQMNALTATLSATEKANCDTSTTDILNKCASGAMTISDPAQRVCTLVNARLSSDQGAIPNLLVYEIMNRAQAQYDQIFSGVLSRSDPNFDTFATDCDNASTGFFHGAKHKIACTASCFFGGDVWSSDGKTAFPGSASGEQCSHPQMVSLAGGVIFNSGINVIDGGNNSSNTTTYNKGFAAYVEWIIRHTIGGKNNPNDSSVCDSINIPSQPATTPTPVPTPVATPAATATPGAS